MPKPSAPAEGAWGHLPGLVLPGPTAPTSPIPHERNRFRPYRWIMAIIHDLLLKPLWHSMIGTPSVRTKWQALTGPGVNASLPAWVASPSRMALAPCLIGIVGARVHQAVGAEPPRCPARVILLSAHRRAPRGGAPDRGCPGESSESPGSPGSPKVQSSAVN